MDKYSTHIPIFEKLFQLKKYSKILELGLGFGSTPFLLKNCDTLTSVEMQSKEWYEKVFEALKSESKWNPQLALGPFAFQDLSAINEKYDLVFVDGHGDSRPEAINYFFDKCDTIVTHDFETSSYRWHLIQKPHHYEMIVYDSLNPFTAIFTKDPDVKNITFR